MQLIDGRALAAKIIASLKQRITALPSPPGLAAVVVGDDPASHLYISLKEKACADVGIRFSKKLLPATTTESELADVIQTLNADQGINGIIIQLPLPPHLDEDRAVRLLDPAKDADGFHPQNIAAFVRDEPNVPTPGLVKAIWGLIQATREPLERKTAAILSNSPVFAQPLITWLGRQGVTARHVAPKSDVTAQTAGADILIVALGQPKAIRAEQVKRGAIVIDVGTTRQDERVVGDVDAESIASKAAWLSPVPGGVGPVTVATLLERVVELAAQSS